MNGLGPRGTGSGAALSAVAGRPSCLANVVAHRDLLTRVAELTSSALLPVAQLAALVCGELTSRLPAERAFVFGLGRAGDLGSERVVVASVGRGGHERVTPAPEEVAAAAVALSTGTTVHRPGGGDRGWLMGVPMCTSRRPVGALLLGSSEGDGPGPRP